MIHAIKNVWHEWRTRRARQAVSKTYVHIQREKCMHTEHMAHLQAELEAAQREFRDLTGIDLARMRNLPNRKES